MTADLLRTPTQPASSRIPFRDNTSANRVLWSAGATRHSMSSALLDRLFGMTPVGSQQSGGGASPMRRQRSARVTQRRPVSAVLSAALTRLANSGSSQQRFIQQQQQRTPLSKTHSQSVAAVPRLPTKVAPLAEAECCLTLGGVDPDKTPTNMAVGTMSSTNSSYDRRLDEWLLEMDDAAQLKLVNTAYYCGAGVAREEVVRRVSEQPPGAFLIRRSASRPSCLALTVRVPHGVSHFLVLRTPHGFKLKGSTQVFGSVQSLVTHYSVFPQPLPCPLLFVSWPPTSASSSSSSHSFSNSKRPAAATTAASTVHPTIHRHYQVVQQSQPNKRSAQKQTAHYYPKAQQQQLVMSCPS